MEVNIPAPWSIWELPPVKSHETPWNHHKSPIFSWFNAILIVIQKTSGADENTGFVSSGHFSLNSAVDADGT